LAQGLAQNKMSHFGQALAAQGLTGINASTWHAGGQRFEFAWLHSRTFRTSSPLVARFFAVWTLPHDEQSITTPTHGTGIQNPARQVHHEHFLPSNRCYSFKTFIPFKGRTPWQQGTGLPVSDHRHEHTCSHPRADPQGQAPSSGSTGQRDQPTRSDLLIRIALFIRYSKRPMGRFFHDLRRQLSRNRCCTRAGSACRAYASISR
jgi:hypothetical protein